MDGDAGFYVGEADSMAVFPHCPADAGTLALVAVAKFDDLIPLARIEKIFARGGESLSRKTTYHWIIALGDGVRITGPASLVEEMRAEAKRLASQYP